MIMSSIVEILEILLSHGPRLKANPKPSLRKINMQAHYIPIENASYLLPASSDLCEISNSPIQ